MSEFYDLFNEEFFIIDSNNLCSVEEKLYGFILNNGEVIYDSNIDKLTGEGTYVLVKNLEDKISIFQDFNGSYGLYIFKSDDYFALSNSFIHLVEFIKNNYKLTLNEDYSKLLMSCGLCSMAFNETLIKEIDCIPRNYIIHIDKQNKCLNYEKIDYQEHSIDLDTKEGLNVLDSWFNKWINILRSIKQKTNNIQVDLSGGFDSRVISVLWLCANIDLDKIFIRSLDDDNHCHGEDFRIASQIASEFNFPLNNNVISTKTNYFKDIQTILNMSFYIKLGFHNQLNYRFGKTENPIYLISGIAGETIRESRVYGGKTPKELIENIANKSKKSDASFENPTKRVLQDSFDKLAEEFNITDKNSIDLTNLVYPEAKCRNHFGKLTVEEYFSNKIVLTPALDPELHKLKVSSDDCDDNYLLITLILLRYCPKLLEFDIEGNRKFNKETIEYARKINEISPFSANDLDFISGPDILKNNSEDNPRIYSWNDVNEYLKDIFYSRKFRKEFEKYFSYNLYGKISQFIETSNYFPLQNAFPAFSVLKIINDIQISKNENNSNLDDWFNSFKYYNDKEEITKQSLGLIIKYATARIDIKNYGNNSNSVEIIEISDENTSVNSPNWFNDGQGEGYVIQSSKGQIDFKIKCINDGNLKISLKSMDVKDKNGIRFPIFIDYMNLSVNDKKQLDKNILTTHDQPYIFTKNVKDGEVINVSLEWLPFNNNSAYSVKKDSIFNRLIKKIRN